MEYLTAAFCAYAAVRTASYAVWTFGKNITGGISVFIWSLCMAAFAVYSIVK